MPTSSKKQKPQLRVVFDTNVLYTGSASDLVQQEAAKLIQESIFPDLEIQWYLPDIVRHERQYQMQTRAADLIPALAKVEKLLGHNLGITEAILIDRVEEAIRKRCEELGLLSLPLTYAAVDWGRVALDAVYRRAPFEQGDKEKGFRDCIIVECFLQLIENSPRAVNSCRIVLLTKDRLVRDAAKARTAECSNVGVLSTLDELKGLINTLVSQVSEEFLALLKPKAERLFFVPKEQSTLFYKEAVRDSMEQKFNAELSVAPPGATGRENGTWRISAPNFVKKTGKRVQWSSRVSIECEATKGLLQTWYLSDMNSPTPGAESIAFIGSGTVNVPLSTPWEAGGSNLALTKWNEYSLGQTPATPVAKTTHRGTDVYEVFWSADVTTKHELRKASIDEIKHIGLQWEQVS